MPFCTPNGFEFVKDTQGKVTHLIVRGDAGDQRQFARKLPLRRREGDVNSRDLPRIQSRCNPKDEVANESVCQSKPEAAVASGRAQEGRPRHSKPLGYKHPTM